ncbi:response regulator transcription factor [Pedobacter changchengzhani]|uniref:Response regulator transcription factor n=1 Tax=Pedobacter changchengzhani TaxID=2529274 RepID=A0A4R5MM88_9SPHI|nr:response regulator transcription factor [Pedobacter changchengzhani]TDG36897.1 response regulator transcription factor [Pedobacter changchengzhani]
MKVKNTVHTQTVLIADDQEIVIRGLKSLISDYWKDVNIITASTIEEAFIEVEKTPNLIIIDVNIPGGNNLKVIDQIKLILPSAKILVFSSQNENLYAVPYLKAGASGYLSKNAEEAEIITAITTILAGSRYSSINIKKNMFNSILGSDTDNPFTKLSKRELEVAELLTKGIGVLQISNQLNLRMGTVSTYKVRLFQKLKIKSIIDLAEKMSIYQK